VEAPTIVLDVKLGILHKSLLPQLLQFNASNRIQQLKLNADLVRSQTHLQELVYVEMLNKYTILLPINAQILLLLLLAQLNNVVLVNMLMAIHARHVAY